MIKKKLILFGAGGHSKSCIGVINLENKLKESTYGENKIGILM